MRRLGREFEERYPDYFSWLCEMVCVDGRYTDEAYWILAKALWDTDFTWILPMDESRAKDGEYLRYLYELDGGTDGYDGPCTVLEMLVALADRMDSVLDELDGEKRISLYFWEMIDNLGLSKYSDMALMSHGDGYDVILEGREREGIDIILEDWMDRRIDYDGTGGLFPLKHPREDQRGVNIWYQCNAYMLENY